MSLITDKFYNLFWQNKACQNLFLLSKDELLDTKEIQIENLTYRISMPRIILSNVENKNENDFTTIKIRNENNSLSTENTMTTNIKSFEPLLTDFRESNLGKSLEKLVKDINEKPYKILRTFISLISKSEEKKEKVIIKFLKEYGFIGNHIDSLNQLGHTIKDQLISKKNIKIFLTDKNMWNLLEFTKSIKDIYINESRKSLYNTNQILIGALHDNEDYTSRTRLFNLLFESNIISPTNEDSFIECLDCEPGTYKGVLQLKLNPKKLENLKCPVCQGKLTYYVPYRLHDEIFEIVKLQDGLLHNTVVRLLEKNQINFESNRNYLKDIEIDTVFNFKKINYLIECKMYKLNTAPNKLENKVKKHFKKLISDTIRIGDEHKSQPILIVNMINENLLREIENSFIAEFDPEKILPPRIMNINQFEKEIDSL